MFCTRLILAFGVVLAVNPIQGSFAPQGRMSGGNSVETLRRFPHHVLIKPYRNKCSGQWDESYHGEWNFCAGSVVNQRWVLTSANCVKYVDVMELSFKRLYLGKTNGSFSVVVNSDAVHVYPTQYDDIALIKLPALLEISDTLQPIGIYSGPNLAAGQFVVMSGYNNLTSYNEPTTTPAPAPISLNCENKMVYGMFSILSADDCDALAGKDYDRYLQYCIKPWERTRNSPSPMDIGSGLVINWPGSPQLVGIYIGSYNWNNVAVFTNVAKYANWINGVINEFPYLSK